MAISNVYPAGTGKVQMVFSDAPIDCAHPDVVNNSPTDCPGFKLALVLQESALAPGAKLTHSAAAESYTYLWEFDRTPSCEYRDDYGDPEIAFEILDVTPDEVTVRVSNAPESLGQTHHAINGVYVGPRCAQ